MNSLCIIQPQQSGNPNDQHDWVRELPNMHRYYENATATLAVESAAGDDEGFFEQLTLLDKWLKPLRSVTISVGAEIGGNYFHLDVETHDRKFRVTR
jgi:hypothetical protein